MRPKVPTLSCLCWWWLRYQFRPLPGPCAQVAEGQPESWAAFIHRIWGFPPHPLPALVAQAPSPGSSGQRDGSLSIRMLVVVTSHRTVADLGQSHGNSPCAVHFLQVSTPLQKWACFYSLSRTLRSLFFCILTRVYGCYLQETLFAKSLILHAGSGTTGIVFND